MAPDERDALHSYYERGEERERLDRGVGLLEFIRTQEIVLRHLPDRPCEVADIGGGPGRYAIWLATLGCHLRHRDVVPLHVEQAAHATSALDGVETAVGDALDVDLDDESVDAVLLLGPLYHLSRRSDRLQALAEARRIVRPGGPIVVAAISRWAARTHSVLTEQLYVELPTLVDRLGDVERSGRVPPVFAGSFTGFAHRPRQLVGEIRAAGLDLVELAGVEGPAALLPDLAERMDAPEHAAIVLDAARALEHVPELMGVGPHFIAVARRPLILA